MRVIKRSYINKYGERVEKEYIYEYPQARIGQIPLGSKMLIGKSGKPYIKNIKYILESLSGLEKKVAGEFISSALKNKEKLTLDDLRHKLKDIQK